jgi:FkbM family methyltransferase
MLQPQTWEKFKQLARSNGAMIEQVIKDFYTAWLPPFENAIDGGAHSGYHTLPLACRLTDGRCLAIDANASMIPRLQARLGKEFGNVSVVHAALQADPETKTVTFHCSKEHPGRSGIARSWDLIAPGTVTYEPPVSVPATTIDKLVEQHHLRTLGFIKLDLEGGEFNALKGATKAMTNLRPVIVSEYSVKSPKINGYEIGEYFQYMERVGYSVLVPNGDIVDQADPFPFWYVFLAPNERKEEVQASLRVLIERHASMLDSVP